MDTTLFRWVLVAIAVLLVLAIYLVGQHQSRLRKRNAVESFTRDEVDSAFIEDEQLRSELDGLNTILQDNDIGDKLDDIQINPALEVPKSRFVGPEPNIFIPAELAGKIETQLVSHHLRHNDFRLITGEEVDAAVQQVGLEMNAEGYLQFRVDGDVSFEIANLSAPGHFSEITEPGFSTLGLNCYIELEKCDNQQSSYETMLKKIDALVRMLSVKVYLPNQALLTISDVTKTRERLAQNLISS